MMATGWKMTVTNYISLNPDAFMQSESSEAAMVKFREQLNNCTTKQFGQFGGFFYIYFFHLAK